MTRDEWVELGLTFDREAEFIERSSSRASLTELEANTVIVPHLKA